MKAKTLCCIVVSAAIALNAASCYTPPQTPTPAPTATSTPTAVPLPEKYPLRTIEGRVIYTERNSVTMRWCDNLSFNYQLIKVETPDREWHSLISPGDIRRYRLGEKIRVEYKHHKDKNRLSYENAFEILGAKADCLKKDTHYFKDVEGVVKNNFKPNF